MVYDDTVEIYTLWDRLKQRFSIVKPVPHSFKLNDTVQPVTNVDFALITTQLARVVTTITGNGYVCPMTVPDGKRWEVFISDINSYAANYDLTELLIRDADGYRCRYYIPAVVSGEITFCHPYPLLIKEGDELGVRVENHTANSTCYFTWHIKETNMEE